MSKFSFKPKITDPNAQKAVDVVATPVAPAEPAKAEVPTSAAGPVVPAGAVPSNQCAVAAPAQNAVTEYRPPATYGDDTSDTGTDDIILPRINFVQGIGDLSQVFNPGDVVLAKETVILKAPAKPKALSETALNIVVVGFRKDRFAEKTKGGAQGDICDSEAEVFAKGATTDWNEWKASGETKKYYQTLAECLILIEQPAGVDDPAFSYIADGKKFAVAVWSQKATSFTHGTKVLRTARRIGWLRDETDSAGNVTVKRGYPSGAWELRAELKIFGESRAWVPQLKRVGYTSAAVQELASKIL